MFQISSLDVDWNKVKVGTKCIVLLDTKELKAGQVVYFSEYNNNSCAVKESKNDTMRCIIHSSYLDLLVEKENDAWNFLNVGTIVTLTKDFSDNKIGDSFILRKYDESKKICTISTIGYNKTFDIDINSLSIMPSFYFNPKKENKTSLLVSTLKNEYDIAIKDLNVLEEINKSLNQISDNEIKNNLEYCNNKNLEILKRYSNKLKSLLDKIDI